MLLIKATFGLIIVGLSQLCHSRKRRDVVEFSFTHGTKVMICKYCGQAAGVASTCPVYSDPKHVFVEIRVPAFCKYCGQAAGVGSTCPVGSDERHVFVSQD